MTKKRFSILHLLLIMFFTALLSVGGVLLGARAYLGSEGMAVLQGLLLAQTVYVGGVEPAAASEAALDGLVAGLGDRWSRYLNAEEYQDLIETRSNAYVGIGVTVNRSREEGFYIVSVEPEGPAAKAGILPGEVITAVDGRSAAGEDREEVLESIAGPEGEAVELTVLSQDGISRTVSVTRATIQVRSVTGELLDGGVGYVVVRNFYSGTADSFRTAVEELMEQGAEALVLDVRNDPGGYVSELTEMLDFLLPEGTVFQSTDWQGNHSQVQSDADCVDLPMAVLVNADSYSAAEFFAAQLRECGAAVVVGEPTCGKGYSQQTYPLTNGGAFHVSTARYSTGSGVSLIGTGVTLDREVTLTAEENALLVSGILEHEADAQLQAALELLNGTNG